MLRLRKIMSAAGLALMISTATVALAPSLSAAAVPMASPVTADDDISINSSICGTGRVKSIATNLPIRRTPSTTGTLITTAQKGYQYNCDITVIGGRVTACGVTSTLWVRIVFTSQYGYTYAACLDDV